MKPVLGNRYRLLVGGLLLAGGLTGCAQGERQDTEASMMRSLAMTAVEDEDPSVAFEWNQIFIDTLIATNTANSASQRLGAIVHAAMFDAYNGVARQHEPLFYREPADDDASARAALIAASYTTLVALNVAMADTAFTTFSGKRFYGADPAATTWRPATAIPLADSDGNPDTLADADWEPLINTPSHPEFPAGHPSLNGAAATILLSVFDDAQTFMLTTAGLPGQTYSSISQARQDGNDARVWGGMHYPSTCAISDGMGANIAAYVNANAMQECHR